MMDPDASREPARPLVQTRAAAPGATKFGALHAWAFDVPGWAEFFNAPSESGTLHAWAFDVPPLAEFFNAPKDSLPVSEPPYAGIADEGWTTYFQVGQNPGR